MFFAERVMRAGGEHAGDQAGEDDARAARPR